MVVLFAVVRLCLLKLNDFVITLCIIGFYTETFLTLKTAQSFCANLLPLEGSRAVKTHVAVRL